VEHAMVIFVGVIFSVIPIIGGAIMGFSKSSDPNYVFGYRSKRSMKDDKAWAFVNKLSGKIFLALGGVIAILTIVFSVLKVQASISLGVIIGVMMIGLIFIIALVEILLKRREDKSAIETSKTKTLLCKDGTNGEVSGVGEGEKKISASNGEGD